MVLLTIFIYVMTYNANKWTEFEQNWLYEHVLVISSGVFLIQNSGVYINQKNKLGFILIKC